MITHFMYWDNLANLKATNTINIPTISFVKLSKKSETLSTKIVNEYILPINDENIILASLISFLDNFAVICSNKKVIKKLINKSVST